MSLSLSFPHWKQSQDAVSSQGAGSSRRGSSRPLAVAGGPSAQCTQTHPEASHQSAGWVPAQADWPEVSQPGGGRAAMHTQVAGPRAQGRPGTEEAVVILWLWKEHSPSAQDVNWPQESPSPQGGSRWEGGP